MTMNALILNFGESAPKIELQGRTVQGHFQQVDERTLEKSKMTEVTLFVGQQALVVGPATVAIVNYRCPSEMELKVETQGRDDAGRFVTELHARKLQMGEHWVFSVARGQQLQLHERNKAS